MWGKIRPLSAALPQWLEDHRCAQQIHWDTTECEYVLESCERDAFVTLNDISNPAAMANDALFEKCATEEEYIRMDRISNNLVMVPCARPALDGSGKVEFASVWLYPRWGWCWDS